MVAQNGPIRIMFAGGGTGGHLYPAMRLAEGARVFAQNRGLPDPEIAFIGNEDGLEGRMLSGKETFFAIDVQSFHRGSIATMITKNLAFLGKLLKSYVRSNAILEKFAPDIMVGTGGYVSGPPVYAAAKMEIPTLIQEQNSYPGVTTRLLAKHAQEIHVAYEEAAERLDKKKRQN
ncbi:MAG: UDP-N-acetylglucosamine--N-acetylmuramyl-(pentapeptide) pyrophosphoryl-undecaprenol N-acetylglucosamine transferase [Candidatus Marinimicrobia bacterium]|nr:UDP-N-acetylglucosamine--N-acetylmuramyl-(pentapeptide) pyrophosphoryl-undecaprenol N-acetylglucosamine transferase [Candidatus Neomarinimicrobiota bacterium]